ncbi:hypothetical protein [Streptomyces syringium]|uniref:hypothetical protein n=1 Tax=Streptomyces syringium TaxID=76729 RepID=UPI0033E8D37D
MKTSDTPAGTGRAYYVISTIGPDGCYKVLEVKAAPETDQEVGELDDALFVELHAAYASVATIHASSAAQAAQILLRDWA